MPDYLPNAELFYFSGNHIGCLLIHGFTGTPYERRGLGERLAAQGYTVLAPVLAGHATHIQDLLPTRWTDWYASVTRAYDDLCQTTTHIFPIGLSLGGVLALHLAAHRPVAGVVAVSAPFALSNPLLPLFQLFPFLYSLFPSIPKRAADMDVVDANILTTHPQYPAYPTRASFSLMRELLPHMHDDLCDITAPVLLIQARGDRTIPADSINEYYARIGARNKTALWIEQSGHLILEDVSKEHAFEAILNFVRDHSR